MKEQLLTIQNTQEAAIVFLDKTVEEFFKNVSTQT